MIQEQFLNNILPGYNFPFTQSCLECLCRSDSQFCLCSCSPTRQLTPLDVHTEEIRVASLSIDKLALLGRIHLARVIIESLRIPPESTQITPRKKGLMGKPPRPASVNKW